MNDKYCFLSWINPNLLFILLSHRDAMESLSDSGIQFWTHGHVDE